VVNCGELIPNIAKNRPHVRSIRSARLNISKFLFIRIQIISKKIFIYPIPITSLIAFPRPAAIIERNILNIFILSSISYVRLPAIVERQKATPKNVSIVSP